MPLEHKDIISCQCGNQISTRKDYDVPSLREGKEDLLGASFVHLSKPFLQYPSSSSSPSSEMLGYSMEYNHGFVTADDYIKKLLFVAENRTEEFSSSSFLCGSCITRYYHD